MKTINRASRIAGAMIALATVFVTMRSNASNRDFNSSYADAKVIAHLVLPGTPPRQMFLQQRGGRQYLYVQQSSQEGFTIVDVTKPSKPKILSHVPQEILTLVASGPAVSERRGDSAPDAVRQGDSAASTRGGSGVLKSVHVLDMDHPETVQPFDGLTSILADDAKDLTFVANAGGIWIVSHQRVQRQHQCSSSDAISADPTCD